MLSPQRFPNEATSSQKVCETRVCSGDQGGGPTLNQCYQIWNENEIFKIRFSNINYALHYCSNRL